MSSINGKKTGGWGVGGVQKENEARRSDSAIAEVQMIVSIGAL